MELESELFWGYALFSNSKWWILVFWHIELQINPILEVISGSFAFQNC